MTADLIIPVSLFAMIYGIVYIIVRRKERLAMIEKGVDSSIFGKDSKSTGSLKWGLLFVGIGIGILLGKVFAAYSCLGEEASMFSMICLFGGLSLLVYHFIERAMEKKSSGQ